MKSKMGVMFVLLAGCIFVSSTAFAGWTQAKGHAYNQLTLSYYKTTSKMTSIEKYPEVEGDAKSNKVKSTHSRIYKNQEEEFTQTQLSYYGEYGLKDDLTAVLSGGWAYVRSNDILNYTEDKDSTRGVGDIIFGLRQKLSDNVAGGPLSVEVDFKIPEAYEYENPFEVQNLGDGQYDAVVKLLYGKGFSKGYAVFSAGYKYRFENDQLGEFYFKPSDQFLVSLSGGYNAAPWLSIRGKIDWNRTVGNAEISDHVKAEGIKWGIPDDNFAEAVIIQDSLGLEQSTLSAGISLAFTLTNKIQTVASYNTDLEGSGEFKSENASLGETFSIALVYMH